MHDRDHETGEASDFSSEEQRLVGDAQTSRASHDGVASANRPADTALDAPRLDRIGGAGAPSTAGRWAPHEALDPPATRCSWLCSWDERSRTSLAVNCGCVMERVDEQVRGSSAGRQPTAARVPRDPRPSYRVSSRLQGTHCMPCLLYLLHHCTPAS